MRRFPIFAIALLASGITAAGGRVVPIAGLTALSEAVERADSTGTPFVVTEATVTHPPTRLVDTFTVCDGTRHLRVTDGKFWPELPLQAGDRIQMTGCIARHDNGHYNYAKATNVVLLAHGDAPAPTVATAREINEGRVLDRPVRFEGRVTDIFRDEIDPRFVHLVLADEHDFVYAALTAEDPSHDERLFGLLDAVIRTTALCIRLRPHANSRLIDIRLSLQSTDAIEVVTPPPADLFSAPPLRGHINDIKRTLGTGPFRRKIRGTVLAVWGGTTALIRNTSNELSKVSFATSPVPACGAAIEAVGVPETDLYTLNLSRAVWRPTGEPPAAPQAAQKVPIRNLFTDKFGQAVINHTFHGQALRFTGRVSALPTTGNDCLMVSCDGYALPVDISSAQGVLTDVEIGCTVDVAGTCVMETENWRPQLPFPHAKGFFLALRGPGDLQVLARPSRWTPGRLLTVIAALAVSLLFLLLRNILQSRLARVRIDERTRLAVELHDTIAQNLTGASFEINAAERLTPSDTTAALRHLGRAARTLKSSRDELRNCIWDLRNRALEAPDMNAAIRRTLEPHVGDTAITVRFNVPRTLLSDNSAHAFLRIIRELTTNAIRHGNAKSVKIAGSLENGILRFSVKDDGTGFDPASAPGLKEGHFGLQGVKERIKTFNGQMALESRPGHGTRVEMSMSLLTDENGRI